jgi:hypothetical protein
MAKGIPMAWTKGHKDPNSVKAKLKSAQDVFEILDRIIEDKKAKASKGNPPDFIDAGWPYKAADQNGYIRAMNEIQNLIPKK